MRRLIFVFPLVIFSCDVDRKFWHLKLILNVSQLNSINTNYRWLCSNLYWQFHAIWSSVIYFFHWPFCFLQDPYTVNAQEKKPTVSYGLMIRAVWSHFVVLPILVTLCIEDWLNARMHNTLSDLFTRRLSRETNRNDFQDLRWIISQENSLKVYESSENFEQSAHL